MDVGPPAVLAYQQGMSMRRVHIGRPHVIQNGRWNCMGGAQEGNRNDTATFAHSSQPLQQLLPLSCWRRRLLRQLLD